MTAFAPVLTTGGPPVTGVPTPDAEQLARDLGRTLDELLDQSMRAVLAALEEHRLTLTQARMLKALQRQAALSVGELADAAGVSTGASSRAVEVLQSRGYVTRRDEPRDRRPRTVALTLTGRRVADDLRIARMRGLVAFTERLAPAQRLRLQGALHLLSGRFDGPDDQ